jgi:acetamidase/formamidase
MTTHTLKCTPQSVHWGFYDAALPPVLVINSGDTVIIDTVSGGPEDLPPAGIPFTLLDEHTRIIAETPRGVGPHILTGPIAVKGAEAGDVLKVEILGVSLRQNWGYNLTRQGKGALPNMFPDPRHIHIGLDLERKTARMPWGLELPTKPFFGCMGNAPAKSQGRLTSVVPGTFGGNIDNRELGAGATLYLPVFESGALFSVGDGHAAQGHGEVNLTAIETALTGTFRLMIEKGSALRRPRAETATHFISMAFDPDLDSAMQVALADMIEFIERHGSLLRADAYALCSIAADVMVTQVVNGSRGIHVSLPKTMLDRSGADRLSKTA